MRQQQQQLAMRIHVSLAYNHTKGLIFVGESEQIIFNFWLFLLNIIDVIIVFPLE